LNRAGHGYPGNSPEDIEYEQRLERFLELPLATMIDRAERIGKGEAFKAKISRALQSRQELLARRRVCFDNRREDEARMIRAEWVVDLLDQWISDEWDLETLRRASSPVELTEDERTEKGDR
jgi:hypothetical protein